MNGLELIAQERSEQIEKHGHSLESDQGYAKGELLMAAEFCLEQASSPYIEHAKWPQGWSERNAQKIRDKSITGKLAVAGAFFIADEERVLNRRITEEEYPKHVIRIAQEIDRLTVTGERWNNNNIRIV